MKSDRFGEEVAVVIHFKAKRMTQEQIGKIQQAHRLLGEAGIIFDSSAGGGEIDWEWDFSLQGPVDVTFCNFVKDDPRNRYVLERENSCRPTPEEAFDVVYK